MEQFNLPKFSKVTYLLNPNTNYFTQSEIEAQETPIGRLPLELRLAPAKAVNVACNASRLLLSRERNKTRYKFITGIQETLHKNWHLGNDYEYYRNEKILSLILFHFTDEGKRLEVYYFYRYDKPNTTYRMQFANCIIPALAKKVA